MKDKYLYY